jgi:hypothetical protein
MMLQTAQAAAMRREPTLQICEPWSPIKTCPARKRPLASDGLQQRSNTEPAIHASRPAEHTTPSVEYLISIDRNTLIADPDLNAALAFLIVQVANDNETNDEQANKQIQSVAVHSGISFIWTKFGSPVCLFDSNNHWNRPRCPDLWQTA